MKKLITIVAGVSTGLFIGLLLSQIHYESAQPSSNKRPKAKSKGLSADTSLYGKKGTYQDQSKSGKGSPLTEEAKTGNID